MPQVTFALTMIGLGLFGLIQGRFSPIWTGVPATTPAREVLAYFCAVVSLGTGLGLLWRRTASSAAAVLLGCLLVWLLLVNGTAIARATVATNSWWTGGQTAVLVAATWMVYAHSAGQWKWAPLRFLSGEQGVRTARVLFGLGLIPFGVAHFTYLDRTVAMVPGWLPWHWVWACFFGVAFIAAGVAVLVGVYARLAATLIVVQLALFTFLVWGPIVAAGPSPADWQETIVSWVLTVAAWVVATSYIGAPWLAAGKGSHASTPLSASSDAA